MKKADLGIVTLHWMMVVILLGAAASGLCLWDERLRPYMDSVFPVGNIGVIHIGASMAVVGLLIVYLWYLRHKNFLNSIALRRPVIGGQVHWRRVGVALYWVLFTVILIETISGILLTKLINQDVLSRVFSIEKAPLIAVHLWLVFSILAFPFMHVTIHWLDGRWSRILSIFQPRVTARRPELSDIVIRLKQENVRLKEKIGDH